MTPPEASNRPHVSVIVPVFNEAGMLVQALASLRQQLEAWGLDHEVLVCENGSTDSTLMLTRTIAGQWPRLTVLSLPAPNYGLALRMGLGRARGNVAALLNVDFLDFRFLQQALALVERDGVDVVVGSKRLPASVDERTAIRRYLTRAFNTLLGWLCGTRLTDTHGLKVMRLERIRPVVQACVLGGEIFDTELLLRAERSGRRIEELPVSVREVRPTRRPVWIRAPVAFRDLVRLIWHVR